MSGFQKFVSMLQEKEVEPDLEVIGRCPCIVTEKIHGSNFSLIFSSANNQFEYATRNQVLNSQNFMNHNSYFNKEFENNFIANIETCKVLSSGFRYVQIYGELYPTQKCGLKYDNVDGKVKWAVFYGVYQSRSDAVLHFSWSELLDFCTHMNLTTVPELVEQRHKTIAEVWKNLNTEFDSKLSAAERNTCEGIVIRVEEDVLQDWSHQLGDASDDLKKSGAIYHFYRELKNKRPIFIKKRNKQFFEVTHLQAPKGLKNREPYLLMLDTLKSLCVKQRIMNVLSHYDVENCFAIEKAVDDIVADIKTDYPKQFENDPDYIQITPPLFKQCKKLLRTFVLQQLNEHLSSIKV